MKTVFICAGAAVFLGGCIDFEEPQADSGGAGCAEDTSCTGGESGADTASGTTGSADDGSDDAASGESGTACEAGACGEPHGMQGEVMVFVNSRLSSPSSNYTSNIALEREGTFLGPAIYLYDPTRECDDGGNLCRIARLGSLRLDESLGEISVQDGSLAKFTLQDIAWSPTQGLWGVSFDVKNDEWGMARLSVPDWSRAENEIGVERWAIKQGLAGAPGTDPCYWQEGVSGLGFRGDELLLGVRGLGGVGLTDSRGYVFSVALDVLDQGYCVLPSDISQDPNYYACDTLCSPWTRFETGVGIAGDVTEDGSGEGAFGLVRSEIDGVEPMPGRIELWHLFPPSGTQMSDPTPTEAYAADVAQGLDIEGLAWVGGKLYGINIYGRVYVIDPETGVRQHDDLGPLFGNPVDTLRVRGATNVVLP